MLRTSDLVRSDPPLHATDEEQRYFLTGLRQEISALLNDPDTLEWYTATRDGEDIGWLRPCLPYIDGIPKDPDLLVRLTTGRTRTSGVEQDGEHLMRPVAAGSETDFAPVVRPLLDLAHAADVPLAGAADVVAALVTAKCVTVRSGR